jgi:serine/threonine protein kinase
MAEAFPMLVGYTDGVPARGDPLRPAVLAALRAALRRVHRAGIVHLDLFPGNILWAHLGETEGGGASVSLRLIDFDAALEVGQRVPLTASTIVERNGHTGSYHPGLFEVNARARVDFDWWHFCLLEDDDCPFAHEHAALPAWLDGAGMRARLLARVAEEVALESEAEAAAGAAAALQVGRAPA